MIKTIAPPAALIATAVLAAILSSRTHGVMEVGATGEQSLYAQSVQQVQELSAEPNRVSSASASIGQGAR